MLYQMKYSDWCVIQSVQNACTRGKIVKLLRDSKVSCMEEHAEDPACKSEGPKGNIVFSQRIVLGYCCAYLAESIPMGKKVEEREEHGGWFLHAQESVERPFAMILYYRLEHWRFA